MGFIIVIILFVFVALIISSVQESSAHDDIHRWASQNGYTIEQVEKTWFDHGPYWFKGKRRIYRCRVRDAAGRSRTVYMRTRFFENDYEFYDGKS